MDVEVVEETDTITEAPAEPEVGSVIYESDLRPAAHSNGWAPDLLGTASVDGPPPNLPDEPEWHDHRPDGQPAPRAWRIVVAGTYLIAGGIGVYIGILMARDLLTEGRKNKEDKAS